jgi:hypothetical protein
MKKKIVGIFVMILLIATVALPVVVTMNIGKTKMVKVNTNQDLSQVIVNKEYKEMNENSRLGLQSSNKCTFSGAINEKIWKIETQKEFKDNNINFNQKTDLSVKIVNPKNFLYIFDRKVFPFFITAIIIGEITVEVKVEGEAMGIEFYVDNRLKFVDYSPPYTWKWHEKIFGSHTLKVIARNFEEEAMDEKNVWIFNNGPDEITREKAVEILINEVIIPPTLDHEIIAFTPSYLVKGDKIAPWLPHPLPPEIESFPYLIYREIKRPEWFFWIDYFPGGIFEHPNRFVSIDARTGDINASEERWWPVLNGESLWNITDEYWDGKNWAYSYFVYGWNLSNVNPSFDQNSSPSFEQHSPLCSIQNNQEKKGAVCINGWSKGQSAEKELEISKEGMSESLAKKDFDVKKVSPPKNKLNDIKEAIDNLKDKKDVVIYLTAHAGMDSKGVPYAQVGGEKLTVDKLCGWLTHHYGVKYYVILDCCYAGEWNESLQKVPNVVKIITSVNKVPEKAGSANPDRHWDTNKDDEGLEFTSGFKEDLDELPKDITVSELLEKAFISAKAKDEWAQWPEHHIVDRRTHPQIWRR